ncbi:hypothetical protein TruAng_001041 [Truncatella angustata]|nr:hypothetical protein TruAng_001041 [Truncatella angustata]
MTEPRLLPAVEKQPYENDHVTAQQKNVIEESVDGNFEPHDQHEYEEIATSEGVVKESKKPSEQHDFADKQERQKSRIVDDNTFDGMVYKIPPLPLQVDHAPKKTPHASAPPAANPPSSTRDRKPMGCPYPGCASQDHTKRHQATHTLECWIDGCQDRNKPFKDTSGIARHLIAMHNNNDSHNCRWNGCEKAKNQLTNHISLHLREHNWELEQAVAKSTQNEDAGDDDESVDADEDQQSYNSRIKKTGGKSRD